MHLVGFIIRIQRIFEAFCQGVRQSERKSVALFSCVTEVKNLSSKCNVCLPSLYCGF